MRLIVYAFLTIMLVLTACKNDKKSDSKEMESEVSEEVVEMTDDVKRLEMALEPRSGSNASGVVVFIEDDGMVKMTATLTGLEPGSHAIHIHEKADCSAEDGTSTGGHWNPTFEPHGQWGDEEGFHRGDIGNFVADDAGNGSISMKTALWCIGCQDEKKDILGKAIIVHRGADDFVSQPSGAAGARVSCGGIIE